MNNFNTEYKKLNTEKLNFSNIDISSEEALKDVTPINWDKKVLSGEKKIVITKKSVK